MLSNFWTYLKNGKYFCGIEHTVKNNEELLHIALITHSKKELHLKKMLQVKCIDECAGKIFKNQQITLVINNNNVLSKVVSSDQKDVLKLIYTVFPNIDLEDFYYDIHSQEHTHFISLCRKDYVVALVNEYAVQHIYVTALLLGNNSVSNIIPYLKTKQIHTSNATVSVKNNQIINIKKNVSSNGVYDINGVTVLSRQILSFIGAANVFLKENNTLSNFNTKKTELVNIYKHAQFFSRFIKIGSLFLLLLLMVNAGFFMHYFDRVNELQHVSNINLSTKNKVTALENTVAKKEKMITDLLLIQDSKSALYSNEIVYSMPKTITLSEFNYQPLKKRIRADKPIEIVTQTIVVAGTSNDASVFSNWISEIEKLNWVKTVAIIDYGAVSKERTKFKIKIGLKNEL